MSDIHLENILQLFLKAAPHNDIIHFTEFSIKIYFCTFKLQEN